MEEVPATLERLVKIWWAFTWRLVVLSVAGGLLLTIPMGFFAAVSGIDPDVIDSSIWLQLVFFALGIAASLLVLKWVIPLRWSDFRIALIRAGKESSSSPHDEDKSSN